MPRRKIVTVPRLAAPVLCPTCRQAAWKSAGLAYRREAGAPEAFLGTAFCPNPACQIDRFNWTVPERKHE